MRYATKNSIFLGLSIAIVLFYTIIDRMAYDDIGLIMEATCPDGLRAIEEVFGKFVNASESMKSVLRVVDAPKLLQPMSEPRNRFQFIIEPHVDREEYSQVRWTSVVIVKSALANKERRDAIRETWGDMKTYNGIRFITIFLLGRPEHTLEERDKALQREYDIFGDILLLDLKDVPKNLPLKTLAGMQWVYDTLPSHWIYSSADDDMSLHVPHFAEYIDGIFKETTGKRSNDETALNRTPIACVYSYKGSDPPERNSRSKWYMPYSLYPPKRWPPYCRGGWYSTSVQMAGNLYKISRSFSFLHLDDVWITGLMRIRYLAERGVKDPNHIRYGLLAMVPLANRANWALAYNLKESVSLVVVSHAWGNIDGYKVDVGRKLKEKWQSWRSSFPE